MIAMILMLAAGSAAAAEWVQESSGQKAYYDADGRLERVEVDADRDGRFEIEERYADRRRVERREDLDGDGTWERRYTWEKDGSAVLCEEKSKGQIQTIWYEPGGAIRRIEKDSDGDGNPDAVWEYRQGLKLRDMIQYVTEGVSMMLSCRIRDILVEADGKFKKNLVDRRKRLDPPGNVLVLEDRFWYRGMIRNQGAYLRRDLIRKGWYKP